MPLPWETNGEMWGKVRKGYAGKDQTDKVITKNLDAFTADIFNEKYLPRYSSREHQEDFADRLAAAENSYFNFPMKIFKVYSNAIFRTTEPVRATNRKMIQRFFDNCDGVGTHIWRFIKDKVFLLNQIGGGSLVVIDKPPRPDIRGSISVAQQEEFNFYPYAYVLSWQSLVNYKLDRWGNLEWILINNGRDDDDKQVYRYWDKNAWYDVDDEGGALDSGAHPVGVVPVVRNYDLKNPKYNFETPISSFDDIVRISLKMYQLMSQLDQMIVAHCFMKIAMPESMYKEVTKSGVGVHNVLVYPDSFEGKEAHYVALPATELDKVIELVFERYPNMLLDLATIRDKSDRPREESGKAKFIDSIDEMTNLVEKAESMELTERGMVEMAARWERVDSSKTQIVYDKNIDIKSTNELLREMTELFKELDGHAPTAARELLARTIKKMMGNVSDADWQTIKAEIDEGIDPSINITDAESLIDRGVLDIIRFARILNRGLAGKSDEEVREWIQKNLDIVRGPVPETPDFPPMN